MEHAAIFSSHLLFVILYPDKITTDDAESTCIWIIRPVNIIINISNSITVFTHYS